MSPLPGIALIRYPIDSYELARFHKRGKTRQNRYDFSRRAADAKSLLDEAAWRQD
jgi:hypothetical protein